MPVVACPFPNCDYVTPDVDAVIVAALITTHGAVHTSANVEKVRTTPQTSKEQTTLCNHAEVEKTRETDNDVDQEDETPASQADVHANPDPEDSSALTSAVACKKRVTLMNWPVPFRLPEARFKSSLSTPEKQLSFSEKASLVDTLYDEMTKYTYRPTKSQYTEVVSNLLARYPHLANDLEGVDAMKYWKNAVSQKFRNERKRHEKNNEFAQRPKHAKLKASVITKNEHSSNIWGVTNYLPNRPEGEDDSTIASHIASMQKESKKVKQDLNKISLLMDLTFPDRRKSIVQDLWKVADIYSTYPCLFDEDEIMAEFKRLTGKDAKKLMQDGLDKYAAAILECASEMNPKRQMVYSAIGQSRSAEDKKPFHICATVNFLISGVGEIGALLLLTCMLHEKIELLLCPKAKELDPEEPQPHIHIEYNGRIEDVLAATGRVKEFAIVAEGEVVAQTSDVLKAVCIVMAVHYVFNMSYHPKLNASLTFIQKVIMNMKDSSPNPKKVIKVLFQVNSKLNAAV